MKGLDYMTFFWFTFADGYAVCTRTLNKRELARLTAEHGKLVSKEAD